MGIEGVIVDLVQEIAEAVSYMIKPTTAEDGETRICWKETGRCRCRMLGYFKEIDSPPPVRASFSVNRF
ncbi:hypothetical protein Pyn_40615 [Prunus yedoensis var. nudiflora]|uniref:Uncharacterized protein n=1 Tax=Prunus yedoensis var. nudiflora TaxID=2094558 RepID=A0A314YFA9_PRUYE|nr:hypothetical protein Pyn_40615 [Prunus yedoensis var. nudiflora]